MKSSNILVRAFFMPKIEANLFVFVFS